MYKLLENLGFVFLEKLKKYFRLSHVAVLTVALRLNKCSVRFWKSVLYLFSAVELEDNVYAIVFIENSSDISCESFPQETVQIKETIYFKWLPYF